MSKTILDRIILGLLLKNEYTTEINKYSINITVTVEKYTLIITEEDFKLAVNTNSIYEVLDIITKICEEK